MKPIADGKFIGRCRLRLRREVLALILLMSRDSNTKMLNYVADVMLHRASAKICDVVAKRVAGYILFYPCENAQIACGLYIVQYECGVEEKIRALYASCGRKAEATTSS